MSEKIENIKNNRLLWIDCAKYVAIIAVAIDHTNGFLYDNKYKSNKQNKNPYF